MSKETVWNFYAFVNNECRGKTECADARKEGITMIKHAIILQNAEQEGPGILSDILRERGWKQRIVHLYQGAPIPDNWQGLGLAIMMGGPMNVHDEKVHPFLKKDESPWPRRQKMNLHLRLNQ